MFPSGIMDKIRIVAEEYSGEGISRDLARGLLVYYGNCNLTGEGMGIGSIALRDSQSTYFSRSWKDSTEPGILRRTFILDTRIRWSIQGKTSGLLTRWIESGVSIYMHLPSFQNIFMLPVLPLRNLLHIHPLFETISPRGKVTFTYRVTGASVDVQAEIDMQVSRQDTICLLNELSAIWFTAGEDGKRLTSPLPGWEKVRSSRMPASLVDPVHGIRFSISQPSVSLPVPFTIYRGRELNGDHCWAGFCLQLGTLDNSQGLPRVQYCIGFTSGVC